MKISILLSLGFSIAVIVVVAIIVIRLLLKRMSYELSSRIKGITPYQASHENRIIRNDNERIFSDIETDLGHCFFGKFITFREETQFTVYYTELFREVNALIKRLNTFHVKPTEIIAKFASDYEGLPRLVNLHNELYFQDVLGTNKSFFDHCLKYPLDKQQRRSIVSEEDNCLVLSSAGSG